VKGRELRARAAALLFGCALAAGAGAQGMVRFAVTGDAIERPLTATPGDAVRGRRLVVDRDAAGCVLCHAVPGESLSGDIAPTLAGSGSRLSPAQLRLRVVDSTRLDPNTPMPAYYRTEGLKQVAAAYRGRPVLSAQQVEDVVAFLATLKGTQ
jgi:L-cysteine S-thiosulfotransferase